jgi:hypothetical protein
MKPFSVPKDAFALSLISRIALGNNWYEVFRPWEYLPQNIALRN